MLTHVIPKNTENSITYMSWTDALNSKVAIAQMKNRAGAVVAVNTASIQSAMDDIGGIIKTGKLFHLEPFFPALSVSLC